MDNIISISEVLIPLQWENVRLHIDKIESLILIDKDRIDRIDSKIQLNEFIISLLLLLKTIEINFTKDIFKN